MFGAPVANWLGTKFHFKAPMFIGLAIFVAAQILAGFSKRIWHLYLTQGLLFGMGLGLVSISARSIRIGRP
jgi:MFS family permease